MGKTVLSAVMVSSVLLAACASAPASDKTAHRAAAYAEAAGAPVRSFRNFQLYSWEPVSSTQLALYTRPNEAWLIDTTGPCPDIMYATSITITSNMSNVQTMFDKIIPSSATGMPMPCTIGQIRPIDLAKLKAVEHEQRKVQGSERPAGN